MIRKQITKFVACLVVFVGMIGTSIPIAGTTSIDVKIREIKKISASKDRLFVLNQAQKEVTTFDQSAKKLDSFFLATDVPNQVLAPIDVAYIDGSIFITDQLGRRILQYTESGKYVRTLSNLTELLIKPSAILAYDQYLLIGDLGCVWITDLSGKILSRIHLPENSDGNFCTIAHISYFESELYLADITNNQILVYKSGENWIDFTLSHALGGFGIERGRFMRLTSAVGYGKIFGCDGVKKNVQSFHPLTKQVEILANDGLGSILPTDMLIWNQKLIVADEKTDTITALPLITGTEFQPIVSTTSLDFGSTYDPAEKQFLIYNQAGYPMKGSITVSNPAFMVDPVEFFGVKSSFTVSIKENLQAKLVETGKITIHLPGNVTKTIEVKVRRSSDPDFTVEYPKVPEFNAYEKQLVFTIETQNRLGEASEIVVQNKNIPFDLVKLDVDKYALLPIRSPLPGIYSIAFTVKAPRNKIIKQITLSFLYKGFEGAVPSTILGEYCVADWCEYCPSGHRALNELSQRMTREQVSFLTYYTDCQQATDQRLCFDEGDKRVKWYIAGGTHVSLYLNGTTVINGGINGPDATMTTEYKEKIDLLLRKYSPISLTGSAILNPEDRSITVGATITTAIKQELKTPRLFCVIAESNIDLLVANKEKIHNFVARQFISLPNPEKSTAYGTPFTLEDRVDIQLQAKIDPLIKLENAYCVIFVQDLTTTEVFQTRFIPLGEKGKISDFSLDCRETSLQDKGSVLPDLEFQLQNQGDTLEEYWTHVPENSGLPPDTELIVNGNSFSILNTLAIFLNPSDVVSIKLHFKSPLTKGKLEQISLAVIHKSTQTTKTIVLPIMEANPNQPRYQILYPPIEELTSKDGFYASMNAITLMIKAEPGTRFTESKWRYDEKTNTKKVPASGILFLPTLVHPGKQTKTFKLDFPDGTTQEIQIRIQGYVFIQMTIGSYNIIFNGKPETMDSSCFILNGRTLVPVRFISEAFGSKVDYDVKTRTITINNEDTVIIMQYNNPEATINGKTVIMDAPYTIRMNRSFVPLRFIAEAFGAKVEWNPRKREIKIRL